MSKEIVIIMGYNAAGKTTLVKGYVKKGYLRINRDTMGGTLDSQAQHAEKAIRTGSDKVVLDNTYASVESRESIIAVAKKLKMPIRCVHLDTKFEDAQFNACARMMEQKGRLLMPGEWVEPNLFPPVALFSYRKRFQAPKKEEGFSSVEKVKFVRKYNPKFVNKAIILDYDQTLRDTPDGTEHQYPCKMEEVKAIPDRHTRIEEYRKKGYILLGVSNQSGIAKGNLTHEEATSFFEETNRQIGHDIEFHFCPHKIPPVGCYCRKPHPGNGVMLIYKHKLDPRKCIFVGDQKSDATFASRCGFQYEDQKEFFK